MSNSPLPSDDPTSIEWEVAVVGTGMGGSTAGYALAKLGRRVLFIEKGLYLHGKKQPTSEEEDRLSGDELNELSNESLRRGWWPVAVRGNTSFGPTDDYWIGCGSGGTTTLYGAGLERFFPADFSPKANFPDVHDSTLPEKWPISYEELRPFYERAEALFRVRGTDDPLRSGEAISLMTPPALSEHAKYLYDSFRQLGLHPYQHHVGFEFVPGCTGCIGSICLKECKSEAGRLCLRPALETHGASILTECEVLRLETKRDEVRAIQCRWKGKEIVIRAKVVVLAAGALMTPALLLNSKSDEHPHGLANRSGMVGRNLMMHAGDFFVMRSRRPLRNSGNTKRLALNDLYQSGGEKLGSFQMAAGDVTSIHIRMFIRADAERDPRWWKLLAMSRPAWWRMISSLVIRPVAFVAYHALNFKRATLWASIIEDLPYYDNRVIVDREAKNGIRFEYRYPEELKRRVASFRMRASKLLGSHKIYSMTGENNLNFYHACGTCRFGDDPETSVLNANNRAHDIENLYVVDASFFPSSAGINPSLTIAANALRVAEKIDGQLGWEKGEAAGTA
jgi:choline dehydrogenase-like flavoprotein